MRKAMTLVGLLLLVGCKDDAEKLAELRAAELTARYLVDAHQRTVDSLSVNFQETTRERLTAAHDSPRAAQERHELAEMYLRRFLGN